MDKIANNSKIRFKILKQQENYILELYKPFIDQNNFITWSKMNIDNHRLNKDDLNELMDTIYLFFQNISDS